MDITWDIESNGLLNNESIDYCSSPYVLKESFKIHCIVVEEHETGNIIAFYDGDTYILDGRKYEETVEDQIYVLEEYNPVEYTHYQLSEFREYIQKNPLSKVVAHNQINFDLLATKLYFGMDYEIEPDVWDGKSVVFEDTLVISKTLNPDRFGGHSLDSLSEKAGLRKIAFRKHLHADVRFKHFAADMLYYNIYDSKANTKVYKYLMEEKGTWKWDDPIALEKSVIDIITRQEHRGFKFDKQLAYANITELDMLMEERRTRVEPILPPRPATKKFLDDHTPPVKQFKQNGDMSANLEKFLNKNGALLQEDGTVEIFGQIYKLPLPNEPLVKTMKATIDDTTHIKNWLVGLGWNASEYKERDLSVNSKKQKLTADKYEIAVRRYVEQTLESNFCNDRLEKLSTTRSRLLDKLLKTKPEKSVKVLTNPSFTKGQDKEMCPDLERISEQFPYAKDVVEYLTFKHRRNSILGGGIDWDEDDEDEYEKGYLAAIRSDGRIPTPAGTCDAATSRFKHKLVANIPRVSSLYGDKMRALFGVDEDYYQIGYDFDSLEAREEAHYCVPMETKALTKTGWKHYSEISEGDLILGYNPSTKVKEWTKVTGKVFYENADTLSIKMGRLNFRATPSHRWYVEQRNGNNSYTASVINTEQLNTGTKVIVNAPFNTYQDNLSSKEGLCQGKYDMDWVQRVLNMSHQERKTFLEGFLIADGYWHQHKQKPVWRWAQNRNEHFEAALLATYLVHDGVVTIANNSKTSKVQVVTLCKNSTVTGQKMVKEYYGKENVWCPQTELGTWVMRQGDCISITGNCWKYEEDPKEYCNSLLLEKPNDVHSVMARKISEIIKRKFERSPAKSVKYGCTYGAQEAKVAKTIGSDLATGKLVFDAFWQAADPLNKLKERLKVYWETVGQKKFILGLDGRKVPTRSAHAILNSLFQSAGVLCAKRAMVIHDRKLKAEGLWVDFFKEDWKLRQFAQQLIAYHDEAQLEVSKNLVKFKMFNSSEEAQAFKDTQEITWSDIKESPKGGYFVAYCRAGELATQSVKEAGEYYKLNVELTAGYILGRNWKECH